MVSKEAVDHSGRGQCDELLKSKAAGPGFDQLLTLVSGPLKLWALFSIAGISMPLLPILKDVLKDEKKVRGSGDCICWLVCFSTARQAVLIQLDFTGNVFSTLR